MSRMPFFWSVALFLSMSVAMSAGVCHNATAGVICGKGERCPPPPKPATPGCDHRPDCSQVVDKHCKYAKYFKDHCFTGVYWECVFGKAVPAVCPLGMFVNQEAIDHPKDKSVALCDKKPVDRNVVDMLTGVDGSRAPGGQCGCNSICNTPPLCPKVVPADCKGSVYLPFDCDCQFYWTCDLKHVPHLSACGAGLYFKPRGLYSGNCVPPPAGVPSTPQVPAEAVACCY